MPRPEEEDTAQIEVDGTFVDLTDLKGVRHSLRRDAPPTRVSQHPRKGLVHLTFSDGLTISVGTSWANLRVHFALPFDLPLPPIDVSLPGPKAVADAPAETPAKAPRGSDKGPKRGPKGEGAPPPTDPASAAVASGMAVSSPTPEGGSRR